MENKLHRLIFLTVVFFFAVGVQAQKRNARYVEYINKYSDLAVEQMKLHKIPASITLAQGLLESGAGYSQLARKRNNHLLSVVAVGGDVRFVMMMMPVTNVSVLISIRVTLTKIIPTSLEEVPVTLFFLNWTSPIIKAGRVD